MDKETKLKLRLAEINFQYHKKQMEYFNEEVKILKKYK